MGVIMYQYPENDLDRQQVLLGLLGTHWAEYYPGYQQVLAYVTSRAQNTKQANRQLQEAVNCVSRLTVPVYKTRNWTWLKLIKSEKNADDSMLLHYGDGAVFGNQPQDGYLYTYGKPR